METIWFFDGWKGIAQALVLGTLGYLALIIMLRLSRKRTLAQMNVFDFVYIVVMGNLLAMTILDDKISLAEGLTALGLLIGLQALISWLTTRSATLERVVNGEPTLLYHRGQFLPDAMSAQRVTEDEILAAMRSEGVADEGAVEAVVLETNGKFSVLHVGSRPQKPTLRDVPNAERVLEQPVEQDDRRARGPGRQRSPRGGGYAETTSR